MTRTEKSAARSRLLLAALVAAPVALASAPAHANLFEVYGDLYVGGMYGTTQRFDSLVTKMGMTEGADFFNYNTGGLLGARAGIELLHTDLYLQFDQFFGPNGENSVPGSALQIMLGWDTTIGPNKWRGVLGGYGGLVLGFPYTPHLPIDKSQIAWIGAALEGQGGVEYNVNRFLVLQGILTAGYHYMFAGAATYEGVAGEQLTTRTHGFHLLFKLGARFHLGI